jgi:hypothetical protein
LIEAFRALRLAPEEKRGVRLAAYVASGIVITHLSYGWHFVLGLLSGRMGEEERAAVPA